MYRLCIYYFSQYQWSYDIRNTRKMSKQVGHQKPHLHTRNFARRLLHNANASIYMNILIICISIVLTVYKCGFMYMLHTHTYAYCLTGVVVHMYNTLVVVWIHTRDTRMHYIPVNNNNARDIIVGVVAVVVCVYTGVRVCLLLFFFFVYAHDTHARNDVDTGVYVFRILVLLRIHCV